MGASDAINALRSEAVAISTLNNVQTEGLVQASQDAQKQSGMVKQARDGADAAMQGFMASVDGQRAQIRSNLKSFADTTVGLIFGLITAAISGGYSGLAMSAMQVVSATLDAKIIGLNVQQRDAYWQAGMNAGCYVAMYTPVTAGLQR